MAAKTKRRYSHAMTVAYEVVSVSPTMPTRAEALAALYMRLLQLENDPREADEALLGEVPFDTMEVDEEGKAVL